MTSRSPEDRSDRGGPKKISAPRPAARKSRTSRKTLRHGLATITRHNPALFPDIEPMAKAICNGDTNPRVFEQAIIIAENEIILRSVRAEGIALIERLRDISAKPLSRKHNTIMRAKMRLRAAKLQYKLLVQARAEKAALNNAKPGDATTKQEKDGTQFEPAKNLKPIKSRDEFDAMRQAMPDLDRLARYERRAWSRRKRAVRDFLYMKARIDC